MCWVLLLLSAVAVGVSHPAFRRGFFFLLSFIFINSVVYLFFFYVPFFLSFFSPPLLFFIFYFLVCFERTAKGFAWTLPLRFLHLVTCKRDIFSFLVSLFFGILALSLESFSSSSSSSVEAMPFSLDVPVGSLPGTRQNRAETPGNISVAAGPVGAAGLGAMLPPSCPAHSSASPVPRRPPPLPNRSAWHREGSPRRRGTVSVSSPRNLCKTRGGNGRFVLEPVSASSGNKMAVGLDFPGFSQDALSVIPAPVFVSVLSRARGRIFGS